jgi:hypothetical protein
MKDSRTEEHLEGLSGVERAACSMRTSSRGLESTLAPTANVVAATANAARTPVMDMLSEVERRRRSVADQSRDSEEGGLRYRGEEGATRVAVPGTVQGPCACRSPLSPLFSLFGSFRTINSKFLRYRYHEA